MKHFIRATSKLDQAVSELQKYIKSVEESLSVSKFVELQTCINTKNIQGTSDTSILLGKFCTKAGVVMVNAELACSSYDYTIVKHDSGFTVTGKKRNYMVDKKVACCSCKFDNDNGLPCRHIFAVRRHSKLELLTLDMIPDRWRKVAMRQPNQSDDIEQNVNNLKPIITNPNFSVLSQSEKYCKALPIVKDFANILSNCGEREFYEKLTFLENVLKSWREGNDVTLSKECSTAIVSECDIENVGANVDVDSDVNVDFDENVCMNYDSIVNDSDNDVDVAIESCTYEYSNDHSYALQPVLPFPEQIVNSINFSKNGDDCDLDAFDINIRNVAKRNREYDRMYSV